MEHARPPAELVLEGGPATRSEAWRKWKKLFNVFLKASGVSKKPKEVQASLLVNLVGPAGYEIFTTFTYAEGESEDDIACLLEKFDSHFGTKPNITMSRYKFFTRSQDVGESIDQYVTALRVLSQSCEFAELRDGLIRDKIVCGIASNMVRDRLLRTDELTLQRAIQICQAAEISQEEGRCIDGGDGTEKIQVNEVWGQAGNSGARGTRRSAGRRGAWRRGGSRAAPARPAHRAPCGTCGSGRCPGNERCPARSAICYVCDNKGHFSMVCPQKVQVNKKVYDISAQSDVSEDLSSSEELFYVNTLSEDEILNKATKEWIETVKCNGKQMKLKIDTGSMLNVISKTEYLRLGLSMGNLKPYTKRVHSFTGNRLPIVGTDDIAIIYDNINYVLPFVIADFNCQTVLGLEGCCSLKLVTCVNEINIEQYSDLFHGLGKLPGKYSIVVDKNVQPVICPTRKIPLGLKEKLLSELHRMECLGVIRKVSHPTDWVNAIVLVAKKDGSIRVCLDPRPLNRAVRRAQYTLPTVTELAVKLRDADYFSVLDARCGFWMVEIDDASADLCTFSTPFGRYQFMRLPYGINCAPEVFHGKLRQYLEDLDGVESFIDDIVVWGRTKEEHDLRLGCLLKRAKEIGIKFNRDKCKFGVKEIIYLGHKFDKSGMRADESKVKAVVEMPYPDDRKSLERFLGMVNYLSKFIQNYSDCVNVLRTLLRKDSEWVWEQHHTDAVDKLKGKLSRAPVLALYSLEAPVVVSVDASSCAVGAVLLQEGRPVEFASMTLTDTQSRYAQIEKEMLAIVFAVERFRQYIYGRADVTVHTDHKPLEALFNKPLVSVPARLQRMMLRVQGYEFKVTYTPGKYLYIADTLSRAPLKDILCHRLSDEVEIQTCFMLENVPYSEQKMDLIRKETQIDKDCNLLVKYIHNGWPKHRRHMHEKINLFWPYREILSYVNGIIFKGDCVFIPRGLREEMLARVHEGHLGIERCKRRAREVMYWPGMAEDVERVVRRCPACALHAPAPRREPLAQHYVPSLPWRKLASDIFEYRKKIFVILVDYFSNFVEVGELTNTSSRQVINFMKDQFARHGIPAELVTDNGPAYSSAEFKKFMGEWEIRHQSSSPHYPQSNGKSERTVQTIKNMLKKCIESGQDFHISLLNFRATPRNNLDSPAQILMGRRINTKLPICSKLLSESTDKERNYRALMVQKTKDKLNYDRSTKPLKPLMPGDKATLIDKGTRKPVVIAAHSSAPRSFIIVDKNNNHYRRNRQHLIRRGVETPTVESGPSSSTDYTYKSSLAQYCDNPNKQSPNTKRTIRRREITPEFHDSRDTPSGPGESSSSSPVSNSPQNVTNIAHGPVTRSRARILASIGKKLVYGENDCERR